MKEPSFKSVVFTLCVFVSFLKFFLMLIVLFSSDLNIILIIFHLLLFNLWLRMWSMLKFCGLLRIICILCVSVHITLLNLLVISSFLVNFLGSLMHSTMLSANGDSLTLSFRICIPLISFSSLIAYSSISSTVLKMSRKTRHLYLIPDISEIDSSFSPFSMMLVVGFHI